MMRLDRQRLDAFLPHHVPADHIYVLDSTGSTNDDARRLVEQGAPHGTLVIANEQTHGRGRDNRCWVSAAGAGIWMSIVARRPIPARWAGWIPLTAGLSAAEAIERTTGVSPRLKWPNDLLVGERKLGGILVESATVRDTLDWMVVGVGVNHSAAPRDEALDAIAIADAVDIPLAPREAVAGAIVSRLLEWLDRLSRSTGAVIRELEAAFHDRDALLGREIEVEMGGERVTGRAAGIGGDGALLIDSGGERRTVRAATVRLIRP
jgi:BirA family biotin operon repressor/biotin-[acetyl-CoA-carboxylase] ligase